ncbi:hypothetical protein D9757_013953 [Collybiopsis confluens]|uniref:Transmembrane protein n=1 Tax=Collybiopsis confluens TaxID=2823264 RepID=A0A8H5LIZ0_9AGAR|nr:hypothetical protein D9757_013953 [Collybiopsis confluens]
MVFNAAPSPFHTFVSMFSAEFAPTTVLPIPSPTLNGLPSILSSTIQSAQAGSITVTSASADSASPSASSASTSPSASTNLPHTSQSAQSGFESASTPASTPHSFIFTTMASDGHSVTETTIFPITTSSSTSLEPAVTQPTQKGAESKSISPVVVRAIVGSLAGVLAFSLGVFLYTRLLRRRRQRTFTKITPLTDLEDNTTSQRRPLIPINRNTKENIADSEASLPKPQLLLQIQLPDSDENALAATSVLDDHHSDLRRAAGGMVEMRARMHRMAEHVQRIEAEVEAGRERDPRNTNLRSDGPPPSYSL